MARSLENKPNVQPPDDDYPFGRIKDNPGDQTGTPVNEEVYGDFHQFFAKLMSAAGVVANENPDNDYSGFQLYEAFRKLVIGADPARPLLRKITHEIGEWDMTAGSLGVSQLLLEFTTIFGVGFFDYTKIREVCVTILPDADVINTGNHQLLTNDGSITWGANGGNPGFIFSSPLGGVFDNTSHNQTGGYNRGWVTFTYEVDE